MRWGSGGYHQEGSFRGSFVLHCGVASRSALFVVASRSPSSPPETHRGYCPSAGQSECDPDAAAPPRTPSCDLQFSYTHTQNQYKHNNISPYRFPCVLHRTLLPIPYKQQYCIMGILKSPCCILWTLNSRTTLWDCTEVHLIFFQTKLQNSQISQNNALYIGHNYRV